jgi:predicted transcriptional regulator
MKVKDTYELDEHDNQAVDILVNLGMNENIAKTLMYISQVDKCRSSDIENGAGLRQPEVSIAMSELRKKGWIDKAEIKKHGKGRPIHIYKANTEIYDIIEELEAKKIADIEQTKNSLYELRSLLENK